MVKHLSTKWEARVQSLGQEDSLEKEMATHSSTLAKKIPWTEEPGVHGVAKSQTQLSNFTFRASFFSCFYLANILLLHNLSFHPLNSVS